LASEMGRTQNGFQSSLMTAPQWPSGLPKTPRSVMCPRRRTIAGNHR
jgi:hypothetical protein